jgi:limonene-1,2-epoxide hydrolase
VPEPSELAIESFEAWNAHDLDRYLSYFHPTAVYKAPGVNVTGDALYAYARALIEAFPDEHVTVNSVASNGSTVFVAYTDVATHLGPIRWLGRTPIEPTERRFEIEAVTEFRFDGDKVAHFQDYFDLYTIYAQLGLPLPKPPG